MTQADLWSSALTVWSWIVIAGEHVKTLAVGFWDLEFKDKLTIGGLVVTFGFSCLNFRRTSQALSGTKANNRAASFERVNGPALNEFFKEINEIGREISVGVKGFTDLASAQSFFKEKVKFRVIKVEHMLVTEIYRISDSALVKDGAPWKAVSKSDKWEEINRVTTTFLSASDLDVAIAHLEVIRQNLDAIAKSLEKVRGDENNI
ncbi:hypothetical protein AGR8A_Cc60464 [Agrobacterium fabrum str. J-07]|uniref:hypothetical protein n=1 Tax=Agrobacterium fabrum TaxID=1176649 RepID=UPI0009BBD328|nr:hypothetical protein [Agrobacterium fabrum]CUX27075.1 hypothetical protein AGR8A_Cc60464 [Agrobacterium fabrum str. J-07]